MSTTIDTRPATEPTFEPHWVSRAAFPILSLALIGMIVLQGWVVYHQITWLAVILVAVISHLMHGQLIGFHEASHSMLRKNRTLNDFDGFLIGTFSFMSFTLYRTVHQSHHMHLATERDDELWPFVITTMPRGKRIIAAAVELTCGIVFTPYLFFRAFFRKNSPIRAAKVRRQIWKEIFFMTLIWAVILTGVAIFGVWNYFLWLFAVPAVISGNLQAWRKYIEHVGMSGNTPNSATRSIVCRTWLGKLFAFSLLHEPYHGIHHVSSGLPHAELPLHVDKLEPKEPGERRPFPHYRAALWDLMRSLNDPRVGGQWNTRP